jgi:tetratricopeptide (TPR) repeat protein
MATRDQSAWLFGSTPDILLGAGLLYLLIIAAVIAAGPGVTGAFPASLFAYLVLIISGSHYGATLLRVYEHEAERRTYRAFTVYGTIAMLGALVGALHWAFFGSLMISLYLTWSPWHYTGQNYGIALMFLRRRGVDVTPLAKRLLHASFVFSFLSFFLNVHFEGGVSRDDPLGYTSLASSGFQFITLGLPGEIRTVVLPMVGLSYVATVIGALFVLLRSSTAKAVAPTALLMLTQAVWFSIPHIGFYFDLGASIPAFDPQAGDNFRFYFVWTALGHAAQYLWITTYYARSDRRWRGYRRYLTKTFVFGNAVWAAPVLLLGPELLGRPDYDSGLAMCVAAAVNLHHFMLDGAIWKLRNPKIAAVLLRSQNATNDDVSTPAPWKRRFAWTLAGLFCFAQVVPYVEIDQRLPAAMRNGDYSTAASILDRAALYGRDSADSRTRLANGLVKTQDPLRSLPHYWRSLSFHPHAFGFAELGKLSEKLQGIDQAIATWEQGLEHFPDDFELNRLTGVGLMKAKRPREALPHLEHAIKLRPQDERALDALAMARTQLDL